MNQDLTIDLHFDLICPWCLIGKRHLADALHQLQATRPDLRPRVIWHSFPLLPDTPLAGLPYQEFYERRLGGPAALAARRAQVAEAGRRAGLEFAFDKIAVMPNTRAAHALIGLIARRGNDALTERLIEALFVGYFMDSRDIGDIAVLIDIAAECGVAVSLQQLVSAPAPASRRQAEHAVSGVPYYVFNDRLALSGAHPPETLLQAMLRSVD
ncbi:MAG: DsbA family oxidoreductase [Dechloromonas sp.]|nr:DsbA family oxidoreductase [Dechloromonas sp.]